jgi:hypothetical protein
MQFCQSAFQKIAVLMAQRDSSWKGSGSGDCYIKCKSVLKMLHSVHRQVLSVIHLLLSFSVPAPITEEVTTLNRVFATTISFFRNTIYTCGLAVSVFVDD